LPEPINLTNLATKIEGDILTITVDLKQRHGLSKSGKTTIIATSRGNAPLPSREEVIMGINIYTKEVSN
jgi:hypothetical protein